MCQLCRQLHQARENVCFLFQCYGCPTACECRNGGTVHWGGGIEFRCAVCRVLPWGSITAVVMLMRWSHCLQTTSSKKKGWAVPQHHGRSCCWRLTGAVIYLYPGSCFKLLFTGLVWTGVKIPQDGNRANTYGHVYVVRGHVWRTLCSVCATGARVAQPVPCNS